MPLLRLSFFLLILIEINPIMQIKTVQNPNMPPATEATIIANIAESVVALSVAFTERFGVALFIVVR